MTSLWLAGRNQEPTASVSAVDEPSAEVVVVGAGITGLMTALLLARAGKNVLVLEARSVGAGASG
jgi:monoamine oxidase